MSSMSPVTFLMVLCMIFCVASSIGIASAAAPPSAALLPRRNARRWKRTTPEICSVCHGLTASSGAHEHLVQAHRVGAVLVDDVVGVDDVAAALAHLLAVLAQDHALVHELGEGLGALHQL